MSAVTGGIRIVHKSVLHSALTLRAAARASRRCGLMSGPITMAWPATSRLNITDPHLAVSLGRLRAVKAGAMTRWWLVLQLAARAAPLITAGRIVGISAYEKADQHLFVLMKAGSWVAVFKGLFDGRKAYITQLHQPAA